MFNATWNATLAAAHGLGITLRWAWDPVYFVYVTQVGDRPPPVGVGLYLWNTSANRWDALNEGVSSVVLGNGDSIALSDSGFSELNATSFETLYPVPTPDSPSPSTEFRGDAQNLGENPGSVPAGVGLAWDRNLGIREIEASSAVAYGRVFVLTQNGMWALDESTGATVWSNPVERGLSSPAVWDGTLLFGAKDGKVHCLNATTGAERWNVSLLPGPTISGITSSPKVVFGTVYVGTFNETGGNGTVVAMWAMNGTIRWRAPTESVDFSAPAVVDGSVYVGVMGRYNTTTGVTFDPPYGVLALDEVTGGKLWFTPTGGSVAASVVVADGVVYAPAKDGRVYAINSTSGAILWSVGGAAGVSSPAYHDGVLYVGGGAYGSAGTVEALRVSDQAVLWSVAPNGPVQASVTYAGGLLVTATNTGQGTVYALDASTGTVVWTYTPSPADYIFASPVVADGAVFATSDNGHVFALRAPTGALLNVTVTSSPSVVANETAMVTVTVTARFGAARAVQVALFLDGLTFVNATWPGVVQPSSSESWNLSFVPFQASFANHIVVRGNCAPPAAGQGSSGGCSPASAKATVIVQYTNIQGVSQSPLSQVVEIAVLPPQGPGVDWVAIGLGTGAGAAFVAAAVLLMLRRRKRKAMGANIESK